MFNLNIKGELGGTALPSEWNSPNAPAGKAFNNFLRELDTCGIKVTEAVIENAGKTVQLPTDIHARSG